MASSGTGMVLKCNICPKLPSFSDVSHLLTHVSSKGHLSCYFKLQVRSNQEPEAAKLLAEYDSWYQEQNLAVLLADRMRAKRNRREKTEKRNSNVLSIPPFAETPEVKVEAAIPTSTPQAVPALLSFLDPRLSYVYTGTPPELPHGLPDLAGPDSSMLQSADFTEPQTCSVYPENMCQPPTEIQRMVMSGSESSSPLMNRRRAMIRPNRRSQRTRKSTSSKVAHGPSTPCMLDDPFLDDSSFADSVYGEEELKQVKLKGILWPGMDIFDSATEQMRKKRNQKKDDSVLKRMEITSKTIEPTEQVFSPRGTLQVERVITGNPDDYSPIKGETPIPPPSKKRSVKPKRPLTKSDGNMYNLRNRVRKPAKGSNKSRVSLEEISRQALPLLEPENSPLTVHQLDALSDDFELSYASTGKRQRHGFEIYNEGGQEDTHLDEERTGPKPYFGGFPSTRAYHHTHNSNPLSSYPYSFVKPYALHRSSTMPECTTNKENIDPYDNTTDYPYFFPPGSQMNFGFLHESNPFGHGRNPLSCSYLPNLQDDILSKSGLKYTTIEPSRVKREITPEMALVEIDKEDFANVLQGF
ncbi:hypothetical protein AAP_04790 [Ascosphaera apis ARSEF 7405]|uniref:Uncharacterized protein n=1 Tax=Ascosphaera apis ARSEF 7405 TaxID=392613 RepID=A0A167WD41_9EURO|nr:hypothetical protein AAP_04790 [Ascosphaera apis ARSEF 7405]